MECAREIRHNCQPKYPQDGPNFVDNIFKCFSWMKMCVFGFTFPLFTMVQLTIRQHGNVWVPEQGTSHYLIQYIWYHISSIATFTPMRSWRVYSYFIFLCVVLLFLWSWSYLHCMRWSYTYCHMVFWNKNQRETILNPTTLSSIVVIWFWSPAWWAFVSLATTHNIHCMSIELSCVLLYHITVYCWK